MDQLVVCQLSKLGLGALGYACIGLKYQKTRYLCIEFSNHFFDSWLNGVANT